MRRKPRPSRSKEKSCVDPKSAHATDRLWSWRIGLLLIIIGVIAYLAIGFRTSTEQLIQQAQAAMIEGSNQDALQLAEKALQRNPESPEALFIAGAAATRLRRFELASGYLEKIPDDGTPNTSVVQQALAECWIQLGYASKAEKSYQRAIQCDTNNDAAREGFIAMLVQEGRMWEAQTHILTLLKRGHARMNHLIVASSPEIFLADVSSFSEKCLAAVPDDPLPLLNEAGNLLRGNDPQQAKRLLQRIVGVHRDNMEAQAQLGRILAEADDSAEFLKWQASLGSSAKQHPAIWFAYGRWAHIHGQLAAAGRCYWEAVARQPSYTAANYQLSQLLVELGQPEKAEPFAERARQLAKLQLIVDGLKSGGSSQQIHSLVDLLESLGNNWEAAGWCKVALHQEPNVRWATECLKRISPTLNACPTYVLRSKNPAFEIDLSAYQLPDWTSGRSQPSEGSLPKTTAEGITFVDDAERVGIGFTYQNGASSSGREYLYEMDGGGIAVLDYDNDDWPDIYFTQGGSLPISTDPNTHQDRVFRNLGNRRFVDVTGAARLGDIGYSQGVTVGDYDNDGFSDLYVANIGPNRFYRNNGDGTFRDITVPAGIAGDEWSSSSVLADFNGDALPDLYVVNYLGGAELATRNCQKQAVRRCAPVDFPAEQDRLYLNLGDGQFKEITTESGIVATDGRGLGIIAADFDRSGRLSLFISNDMSANYFFANQTTTGKGLLQFSECGVLLGLGYNPQGIAQACMGIAAEDANEDGLLDLFVTNFYHESNAFYVQHSPGLFRDQSHQAGLKDSGFEMLGWGTQFVDADLDGRPDLIVANGHIHDPMNVNTPYRMQPQFYRNKGKGKFSLMQHATVGEYFERKHLGRAAAKLDWNRDGLEDICISHLDTPIALLTNSSQQHGHFLTLRLVGVNGSRDAIGTTIRANVQKRTLVRQLIAGDGFQASNQRQLHLGLGDADAIEQLEISWPSGLIQVFTKVPLDNHLLAIEGEDKLRVIR